MSANGDGAASQGATRTTLELVLDTKTMQVTIGGSAMPISLAQMICGEALRLLEEQRRIAAAVQFQEQVRAAAQEQAIRNKIRM